MTSGVALVAASLFSAFFFGWFLVRWWCFHRKKHSFLGGFRGNGGDLSGRMLRQGGVDDPALLLAALASARLSSKRSRWTKVFPKSARWFEENVCKAGVDHVVTAEGACVTRLMTTVMGFVGGVVTGCAFSVALSVVLGTVGVVIGWRSVVVALSRRRRARANEVERQIPHMLEVLSMGLRSGLSYERSLRLYTDHFDTELACSCNVAYQKWAMGLMPREQALRELASSYDSALLSRVVEGMTRSLRLGTSLADDMAAYAKDAREAYFSQRQEQAAKVPVKMMIPTGTLMLPAMLLLVMGPILLELIEGF